jgi:hypothetical protein
MNAVEIEEAVSELAAAPFDPAEFPFAFLTAFGNKATTVNRLRTPSLNKSDVAGGVLQARNIHLAVCAEGRVRETMTALRESPKTAANKVKFLLATDGVTLEAEDLVSDEPPIVCDYPKFAEHFGFFLPLAGISTVRAIKNNPIDIKATGRLNKLYVELLKDNPEWATEARRHEMNQFMARLIFCFFAEDTGIFLNHLFTKTIEQMSDSQSGNTHEVLQELFRAMDTRLEDRKAENFRPWADAFPYVNGGLFTGSADCPRFSRIARSYLLRAAELNWQEINPDIFGSMIQAVADDEERGELGMHYTSVPNILKVLNPLFLDDLREQLEAAGDNLRKLRNLRKRLSTIRVFDPACGSGNFLVIAYREMRQIEHEIIKRTDDQPKSVIPLANFYGIEIKGFAAEIARLALLIAEFQCDVRLISQREAQLNVLPLHKTGQIHIGNALRLNWMEICPPSGKAEDEPLSSSKLTDAGEDERTETYICGNPQFKGARKQTKSQKEDLSAIFDGHINHKDCDYVVGWFVKAAEYVHKFHAEFAFVSTNSISQGEQVGYLWSRLYAKGLHIAFAHQGFKWKNNASNNAVVHCVIIGVSKAKRTQCSLYSDDAVRVVSSISPYLVPGPELYVSPRDEPLNADLGEMVMGSMARDDGNLILSQEEAEILAKRHPEVRPLLRGLIGSQELIHYRNRSCLWIGDENLTLARSIAAIDQRIQRVRKFREESSANTTRGYAAIPHKFAQRAHKDTQSIVVAATSSENRPYLPVDLLDENSIVTNAAYAVYNPELWEIALVASKLHIVWVESICGKLETRLRYSSTLGWNTFPVPSLTNKDKTDLSRRAEDILLAREAHFPATIADLYDAENMPDDLRAAHDRNDETLERIYIGRRFRNDTERLEKLFDLYTKMTADKAPKKPAKRGAA